MDKGSSYTARMVFMRVILKTIRQMVMVSLLKLMERSTMEIGSMISHMVQVFKNLSLEISTMVIFNMG